ncbi:MAG: ThuA domain-containing protein [Phycisphaerales bacterium]|nr:MAG: ThuA domain-containing protein [Phycisphaerales bacterium]
MKRAILISIVIVAVIVAAAGFVAAARDAKVKVLFLRGGGVHDWKGCTPILTEVLNNSGDFAVTYTENLDDLKDRIRQFDIIIHYTTGLQLNEDQETGLCDFVNNGGGYLGIHSASDSFKNSDRFWEMVGGRFAGHGGGKFTVHIYDAEHPITRGLQDFEIQDETYSHNYHKNATMRCLTRMSRGNERQSMCWISHYGKGRMFYTGNGHGRQAWANPTFQRLVVRGAYWAAGLKVKDPPR